VKYTGINKEGFERDARLLLEHYARERRSSVEFEDAARALADAYGIGHAEIWDILPEYEAQVSPCCGVEVSNTLHPYCMSCGHEVQA
jgi:hypothetical protein